jgi:hypothetical protein
MDPKRVERIKAAAITAGRQDIADLCNWYGKDNTNTEDLDKIFQIWAIRWNIK